MRAKLIRRGELEVEVDEEGNPVPEPTMRSVRTEALEKAKVLSEKYAVGMDALDFLEDDFDELDVSDEDDEDED